MNTTLEKTNNSVKQFFNKLLPYFGVRDTKTGNIKWHAWFILFVELIGTIFLVFWICFPNAFAFEYADVEGHWANGNATLTSISNFWATYFSYPILLALYVCFGIFVLVICTIWVSANFNPAVTTVEMIKGNDPYHLGLMKIGVQFLGAFAAAIFVLELSKALGTWDIQTSATTYAVSLDAIAPAINPGWVSMNIFEGSISMKEASDSWFWFLSLLLEFVYVYMLLALVFIGKMNKVARTAWISMGLVAILWVSQHTMNVTLNPARALAPAVVHDIARGLHGQTATSYTSFVWIYILGQMAAAAVFGLHITYKDRKNAAIEEATIGNKIAIEKAKHHELMLENSRLTHINDQMYKDISKHMGIHHGHKGVHPKVVHTGKTTEVVYKVKPTTTSKKKSSKKK